MIFGIGCDVVNTDRLEKTEAYLEHLMTRIFSEREREAMSERSLPTFRHKVLYVAKRFAGKEAVSKALGTGFRNGLRLSDIEIFNDELGKPYVCLPSSITADRALTVHLSLSDDAPYAQAFAVIELS